MFVFELTRDYDVILPLMLATVMADLVCSAVCEDSLMTEKLRRRGSVGRHYGVDVMQPAGSRDIMTRTSTLPATAHRAPTAMPAFLGGGHGAYPVVDARPLRRHRHARRPAARRLAGRRHAARRGRRDVVTVAPATTAAAALGPCSTSTSSTCRCSTTTAASVGICTRTDLLSARRRHFALDRRQRGWIGRPHTEVAAATR